MTPTVFIAFLGLVLDLALAQAPTTLIAQNLPACAQTCPILLQAQGGCVPPAAAVTNQGQYQSCFCQSAFLTPLYQPTSTLCPVCSTQDMATIQTWFQGLCKQGAPVVPQSSSSTPPTPTTTSSTLPSSSTGALVGVTESQTPNGPQPGWMSTHWRWVVMLIVLAIGLSLLALGGWLLRRHLHRRRVANPNNTSGTQSNLQTWGPGQSVHDFGAVGEGVRTPHNEKGKEREQTNSMPEVESGAGNRSRGSRLLKKGWLRK